MGNARIAAVAILLTLLTGPIARASFHFWGINEVYSNASGTVQFVEMTTTSGFEQFLQGNQFTSNTQTLTFNQNFALSTANKTFLMATPGYVALGGLPTPDFVFPVNNFFNIAGDTLTLQFGSGDPPNPASLTFTSAHLPTDGIKSMKYDLTQNTINSPKNFAGTTGAVPEPTAAALGLIGLGILLTKRQRAARSSEPIHKSPG